MIFVTTLDVIPGKNDELKKIMNKINMAGDIKIMEFLSLFGKPDYLIVFEAPDEEKAMSYVLKFAPMSTPKTSLAVPVDRP